MGDMTLIRPINKGQGHLFWDQSISHMRLTIGCQVLIGLCSVTHRLATVHINVTDDRQTTTNDGRNTVAA